MSRNIEMILTYYRKEYRFKQILVSALRIAEHVSFEGLDHVHRNDGADIFSCPLCMEEVKVEFYGQRVLNVPEIAHKDDCALKAYDDAVELERGRGYKI